MPHRNPPPGKDASRRTGEDLPPPKQGKATGESRRKAVRDLQKGHHMAPRYDRSGSSTH